ncbi:carbohydrate ABC transporter permease [Halanaerobium sp. ST460_2HS_T2]|uniref:carbohydrate ABC transporter permease n=1 Tax=Halanaerobium sp. ST460_2HS_T2 TaxID=2183914 RepID=UPI000DF33D8D|nr:sugar ABC transporter permease [Halanaerobium sp. ST460_2HS_T2]RCW61889.1 carbohydrate ABC transporter membrane protein 1 (CUT1 family) [Halanaerobium sp. ST460_2HS_T2]
MQKVSKLTIFIFLLPALLIFSLYMVAPIPLSAFYSFFRWKGFGERVFVGLNNWIELIGDGIFHKALFNNFKLVFLSLFGQLPIALGLAILLAKKTKTTDILKTIYFVPLLMSSVAVATLWSNIYDPNFGLLNMFLQTIGFENLFIDYLGNPKLALYSVIVAINWRYIPFYMILFLAAIKNIPDELYEASRVDGASKWENFRYITLPLLRPTIINASVLSLVGSLKFFDIVYVLTGGGPNNASELMATYMYKNAFNSLRMGYGSTIALALFIIAFTFSIIFMKVTKKGAK